MACEKILLVDDASTVLLTERMIRSKDHRDLVTARDGRFHPPAGGSRST